MRILQAYLMARSEVKIKKFKGLGQALFIGIPITMYNGTLQMSRIVFLSSRFRRTRTNLVPQNRLCSCCSNTGLQFVPNLANDWRFEDDSFAKCHWSKTNPHDLIWRLEHFQYSPYPYPLPHSSKLHRPSCGERLFSLPVPHNDRCHTCSAPRIRDHLPPNLRRYSLLGIGLPRKAPGAIWHIRNEVI